MVPQESLRQQIPHYVGALEKEYADCRRRGTVPVDTGCAKAVKVSRHIFITLNMKVPNLDPHYPQVPFEGIIPKGLKRQKEVRDSRDGEVSVTFFIKILHPNVASGTNLHNMNSNCNTNPEGGHLCFTIEHIIAVAKAHINGRGVLSSDYINYSSPSFWC